MPQKDGNGGENYNKDANRILRDASLNKKFSSQTTSILLSTHNVNGVDIWGYTPLMWEIIRINLKAVEALLNAGADPTLKLPKDKTALKMVDEYMDSENEDANEISRLVKERSLAILKRKMEDKKRKRGYEEGTEEKDNEYAILLRKIKIESKNNEPKGYSGADEPEKKAEEEHQANDDSGGDDAANDSLDADEEKIEEERSSENNPFLEREIHLVELFEEYQDGFSAHVKEEDEIPENIESFEYADYKHLPMTDDMAPEIIDPSLAGILPQVSGIFTLGI